MLITEFPQFRSEGHQEPHNEVGFQNVAEHLMRFEAEPSGSNCCTPIHTRPLLPVVGQLGIYCKYYFPVTFWLNQDSDAVIYIGLARLPA